MKDTNPALNLLSSFYKAEEENNYRDIIKYSEQILALGGQQYPSSILRNISQKVFIARSRVCKLDELVKLMDVDDCSMLAKTIPCNFNELNDTKRQQRKGIRTVNKKNDMLKDLFIAKTGSLGIIIDPILLGSEELEFYQPSIEPMVKLHMLERVGERPISQETTEIEIQLENEFMPVFICFKRPENHQIFAVEFIPFPSAVRNGLHYAELAYSCPDKDIIDAINEFSNNILNQGLGKSLTKIFSAASNKGASLCVTNKDFKDWIEVIHGISVQTGDEYSALENSVTLVLPEKMYPAISTLTSDYEYIDPSALSYCYNILSISESDMYLQDCIQISTHFSQLDTTQGGISQAPYVIEHFPDRLFQPMSDHLMSIAMIEDGFPRLFPHTMPKNMNRQYATSDDLVIVVKNTDNCTNLDSFLLALACQQGEFNITKLILLDNTYSARELQTRLNELCLPQWSIDVKRTFSKVIKALPTDGLTLIINPYILMQNPWTIGQLIKYLQHEDVASTSCMLTHLVSPKRNKYAHISAGMYPRADNYLQNKLIYLEAKNITSSLPPLVYNVICNHYDLALFKNIHLKNYFFDNQIDANTNRQLANFSVSMALNGRVNVVTTEVSAQYIMAPTPNTSVMLNRKNSIDILYNWKKLEANISNISRILA